MSWEESVDRTVEDAYREAEMLLNECKERSARLAKLAYFIVVVEEPMRKLANQGRALGEMFDQALERAGDRARAKIAEDRSRGFIRPFSPSPEPLSGSQSPPSDP